MGRGIVRQRRQDLTFGARRRWTWSTSAQVPISFPYSHHFWAVTREAYLPEYRLPQDPMPMLRTKSVVKQGSICDLPERTWDAATMFFCAESITEHQDEFEVACAAFARS
jgi:hypothetical protein